LFDLLWIVVKQIETCGICALVYTTRDVKNWKKLKTKTKTLTSMKTVRIREVSPTDAV